uniref:Antitoxin n=1 Tax=Candidatus Kentrum sp. TUN TaxID=2126343 RepID=A0A450ZME9_9GAMM|nr:MAG: prevent-host-death family protein [Candidatus Kentron sp. TUN]VFK55878.1 MAG: prevent-host-death family protein [Candidatus Kentron sp. TUN]VFK61910.1 MAG: prevent-host-death family protein [Candidatus Kentron sp. TUN]
MTVMTLSSRDFNQHTSQAKKASFDGPVFITERGRPAHVLLSIEDYRNLTGDRTTLLDALAQTDGPDFEFEPPRMDTLFHPADLS